jgi:hypothetical protein
VLFIEAPGAARVPGARLAEAQANVFRLAASLPEAARGAQCEALLPLVYKALHSSPLAGRFLRPMQWFCTPECAPALLGEFGALGAVYDCAELARDPEGEAFLLANADLVLTATRWLQRQKSAHNRNVHCFEAVDDAAAARMRQLMLEAIAVPVGAGAPELQGKEPPWRIAPS